MAYIHFYRTYTKISWFIMVNQWKNDQHIS